MSTDGDLGRVDRLVSSSTILDELVQLRQREGISLRKVEQGCPTIQSLRATTEELRHRGLDETDRHVAAFSMLRCAAKDPHMVPRTDYCRILVKTLNFDGSDDYLDQRRRHLCEDLNIGEKAYRRLEDEAYRHFVSELLIAKQSPCVNPQPSSGESIELEIRLKASSEDLARILNMLTLEVRRSVRQALADQLFTILPGGRESGRRELLTVAADYRFANLIIFVTDAALWPPPPEEDTPDAAELLLPGDVLSLLFSPPMPGDPEPHFEAYERARGRFGWPAVYRPNSEFYAMKARSVEHMARYLWSIYRERAEQQDDLGARDQGEVS